MKILLVDVAEPIAGALRALGHEVRVLRPAGGIYSFHHLSRDFRPDIFFQMENLGVRVFVKHLDQAPCLTLFWAIDSHLNLYWQRWYALLFDAVLTPHVSLFKALPALIRPGQLQGMAWPGQRRAWLPHAGRAHDLSFCGRLSRHRPIRSCLVELLEPEGLFTATDISLAQMMDLYDQSRVAPNESIALETNFRLLEAASCGCLVLGQDVGDDQNCLLTPGKEFLVYRDGLELLEQTRWAKSRPEAAEAMGRAAMKRIQAEHLPEQRVAALLELAGSAGQMRLGGADAELAFWLAMAPRLRNRSLKLSRSAHAAKGQRLARQSADRGRSGPLERQLVISALAEVICLMAESEDAGARAEALLLCREAALPQNGPERPLQCLDSIFEGRPPAVAAEVGAAASALALREGALPLARQLRLLSAPDHAPLPADEATGLCLQWSRDLLNRGEAFQSGFGYAPEMGMLPQDALSWLVFARQIGSGDDKRLLPQLEAVLARVPGLLYQHMGALAERSLGAEEDWRLRLEYGLACLKCLRVEPGLHELRLARNQAREKGEERAFAARAKGLRQGLGRLLKEDF
ncbi:glycosyltransferase [Desulfovibrio sp. OttesenSCG-928-G11]|nr:glycosyltransferase [Desulfovibrio sp. OttesenSCG-928-G11]